MTNDSNVIHRHYAEVAADILERIPDIAKSGRASCETCIDDMQANRDALRSEAAFLYARKAIAELPAGAVAASRGCGDPVAVAELLQGETVLDLGSGGGIDALIAAKLVGDGGHVYGVDMTDEMVALAQTNAQLADAANVSFLKGHIESIPLEDETVDVVISNCVINLSSDKQSVLREAHRVLKPGGRLVVSDIVAFQQYPPAAEESLRRLTGCLNGMQDRDSYIAMLRDAGFDDATIEPKTIYTLAVLREKAERKGRMAFYERIADTPDVDGATGSAIVRAWKH